MPRDYQGSEEFQNWWNAQFDPDETGRTRTIAALAFDAGKAANKNQSSHLTGDIASRVLPQLGYRQEGHAWVKEV